MFAYDTNAGKSYKLQFNNFSQISSVFDLKPIKCRF